MDFDDQEDADEEIGMPVGLGYDNPINNNSSRSAGAVTGGAKLSAGLSGGGGTEAAAAATMTGDRRVSSETGIGKYRECLKNHAVGIGGHAVDGCGEFMAAGEEGTLDALRCAACNCHRNFHRKETTERGNGGGVIPMDAAGYYHPQFSPYYRTPAAYLHPHHYTSAAAAQQHLRPHVPLALPSMSWGGGGGHSSRDDEDVSDPMIPMGFGGSRGLGMGMIGGMGVTGSGSGKKRFRTKFTQEQKEKMLAFSEQLGWRIQKHDEAAVQQFCNDTGVKRHVLKVWTHNNKHTIGKKL